jgi:hypothetical protein
LEQQFRPSTNGTVSPKLFVAGTIMVGILTGFSYFAMAFIGRTSSCPHLVDLVRRRQPFLWVFRGSKSSSVVPLKRLRVQTSELSLAAQWPNPANSDTRRYQKE